MNTLRYFLFSIFLLFSLTMMAQESVYSYKYNLENVEKQQFDINIPDSIIGEFLSFSFRIDEINHPEFFQIFLSQIDHSGKEEIHEVRLEDHSYQEETKNKENTYLSELIFIQHEIKKLSLIILSKQNQIRPESHILIRLYNPFVHGSLKESAIDTGYACTKPTIRTRTQWGCPDGDSCLHGTLAYTTVTHLIVHHSAGANTSSNWDAVMRSIWDLHVNTNQWIDVGYNYLIDPNGIVYEGRAGGDNVQGAHFSAMNSNTMGVCVLGTYSTVLPSYIAMKNAARILGWKAQKEGLNPFDSAQHTAGFIPRIAGHRSSGSGTECPGDSLYAHLPELRQMVKDCFDGVLAVSENSESSFAMYPNPTADYVFLETQNEANIIIYNSLGIKYYQQKLQRYKNKIPLERFPKGIYFVVIQNEKSSNTEKLIIQ